MENSNQGPSSSSKYHRPYWTPTQVEILSEKQRGKLSAAQEDKIRQSACSFIEAMGQKIGFPRRTIATAQDLYHRFHLYFPRKDFNYFDVSLASIYVSTKMHDTLKKPRELLAVSYALRYPEFTAKSKTGEVDLDHMDQATVEHDRSRLLAVERLILETICFNFTSRMSFPYVIKIGKALGASKQLTRMAWRVAVDSHRTMVTIQYPPHVIALGGLYVAGLLSSIDSSISPPRVVLDGPSTNPIALQLGSPGEWETRFQAKCADLEEIAHSILDLLIQFCQNPAISANTSPGTPSSPSQTSSSRPLSTSQPPFKADHLMHLKIALRQRSEGLQDKRPSRETHSRPDAKRVKRDSDAAVATSGKEGSNTLGGKALGKNEGTMRFLFGPPPPVASDGN